MACVCSGFSARCWSVHGSDRPRTVSAVADEALLVVAGRVLRLEARARRPVGDDADAEVVLAAQLGIGDRLPELLVPSLRDQVPVAYVVPRDPSAPPAHDQLAAWAQANLSKAARPVEWHVIDELPRTSVGKVRRFKLNATSAPGAHA